MTYKTPFLSFFSCLSCSYLIYRQIKRDIHNFVTKGHFIVTNYTPHGKVWVGEFTPVYIPASAIHSRSRWSAALFHLCFRSHCPSAPPPCPDALPCTPHNHSNSSPHGMPVIHKNMRPDTMPTTTESPLTLSIFFRRIYFLSRNTALLNQVPYLTTAIGSAIICFVNICYEYSHIQFRRKEK